MWRHDHPSPATRMARRACPTHVAPAWMINDMTDSLRLPSLTLVWCVLQWSYKGGLSQNNSAGLLSGLLGRGTSQRPHLCQQLVEIKRFD
jgi:hypothetical protein